MQKISDTIILLIYIKMIKVFKEGCFMEKIKLNDLKNICGGSVRVRVIYFFNDNEIEDIDAFIDNYKDCNKEYKEHIFSRVVKEIVYDIYYDDYWGVEDYLVQGGITDFAEAYALDNSYNDHGFINHSY